MSLFKNQFVIGLIPCLGGLLLIQYLDKRYEQNNSNKKIDFKKEIEDFNRSAASRSKHVQASKESIAQLLEDLKHKTTYEKLTDAYNASVKTHEIGFPSSLPGDTPDNVNHDDYSAHSSTNSNSNKKKSFTRY